MRRVGGLWPAIVDTRNLLSAAAAAAAGKRKRPDVASFLLNLEPEVLRLQRELLDGSYRPGPYREFLVSDPKARQISAAPFRDRVVHHALTRILEPVFETRFSAHSYACRKGMGVHRALSLAARWAHQFRYVLKCDVRKYFASIDHEVLTGQLRRIVKCEPTLDLAGRILDGFHSSEEESCCYFPGDCLFTPLDRPRGLPLGNQTSQFFANVYLNTMDHLIEQNLQPGSYARYVDDLVLFDNDKEKLNAMRCQISGWLADVRLRFHEGKSRIYRCRDGVTFLGWRIYPDHQRLVRGNVIRFRQTLRELQSGYASGEIQWEQVEARVRAWIAHASHGDTLRLRERLFEEFVFHRVCDDRERRENQIAGHGRSRTGRVLQQQ